MLMFISHLQIAVLDTLAQLGCDPSIKDSVSSTPMHVAAGEGHIEAILKLVALVSNAVLALVDIIAPHAEAECMCCLPVLHSKWHSSQMTS